MNLPGWLEKIREYSDENVKIALVANKKDLCKGSENVGLFHDVIKDTEGDENDNHDECCGNCKHQESAESS